MGARKTGRSSRSRFSRSRLNKKSVARKNPTKPTVPYVLIVCEGSKTEHEYLIWFREAGRLSNVKMLLLDKGTKSSPTSVANEAIKKIERTGPASDGGFDKLFCVIDRDTHSDFESGCQKIDGISERFGSGFIPNGCELILSVPCFEFWLLLHFERTRRPFEKTGRASPCDNVIARLRNHTSFEDYDRKGKGIYRNQWGQLSERYESAVKNAEHTLKEYKRDGEINPSTNVHHLTEYLQGKRRDN